VQPVGHRVLVQLTDGLGRCLDHLRRGVGVRGVLGRDAAVVPLGVLGDELLVLGGVRLLVPADGVEDALGVRHADAVAVLAGVAGRRGLEQHLRRVVQLLQRADQAHAVLEDGALSDQVRLLVGDRAGDRLEVRGVGGIRRRVDRLDAELLELLLHGLDHRRGERVVLRRVRGGLGPLVLRQALDVLHEHVGLVLGRGLLREEQLREAAVEHLGRTAGGLDVEHVVLLRDGGRGEVQQRREGAEEQVDVVLGDELRVVGDDGVLVAGVIGDLQLHLTPEQAAVGVDLVLPDLVAPLGLAPRLGEVTRQRQGDADDDRLVTAGRGLLLAGRRATGGHRQQERCTGRQPADRRRRPSPACKIPSVVVLHHRSSRFRS
jgi:hypothetical protein